MGYGIDIKCNECEYSKEYLLGMGMAFSSHEALIESLPKNKRDKALELLKIEGTESLLGSYFVYQCDDCKSVQNIFDLQILDKDKNVLFKSFDDCPKCKKPRRQLNYRDNKLKRYRCPKCKSDNIDFNEGMMWD
ncbi:hypothetical protein N9E50_02170 [Alphaproteobacteria bacterium]|nr:hypothetical protein [Alphaproteobacteria bacterium]